MEETSKRRILSLWFPRLGAEYILRKNPQLTQTPLAIVESIGNAQLISSASQDAEALGIWTGQPARDAHAMCAQLVTKKRSLPAESQFLSALRRWSGKISPWTARDGATGLILDITGCAHLFGGEDLLLQMIDEDCADMGLCVQMGLADTRGAAWALARYADKPTTHARSGDAIQQEARATRSRAGKRHWTKGGAARHTHVLGTQPGRRRAAPGRTYAALAPLPVVALRIAPETAAQLSRLGMRTIGDLVGQPRAALARRFGKDLLYRIDQALGSAPEPISPAKHKDHFATRLTLPDPIGLKDDLMAGIDRLLSPLCIKVAKEGQAIRIIRLEAHRVDRDIATFDVALARPSTDIARIRPLLEMKLDKFEAGYGIDILRLEARQTEPVQQEHASTHMTAHAPGTPPSSKINALEDLIGRIGARTGMDAITRLHPGQSHIPEKTAIPLAAAWSDPHQGHWPKGHLSRPLLLWPPEIVTAPNTPHVPEQFRWRGRTHTRTHANGPERISPEWWLDMPEWRSGTRDYWRVTVEDGHTLWLYFAHGATLSSGWFCHGSFG